MTITFARGLLAATAMTLAAHAAPASAQSRGELERIRDDIRDLQAVVYSVERQGAPVRQGAVTAQPGAGVGAYRSDDILKIAQLEEEIAELTGRIEELTFRMANQQRQLDTIMAVLGDTRGGGMNSGDGAVASSGPGDAALPLGDATNGRPRATEREMGAPGDLSAALPPREDVTVTLPEDEDDAYDVAYEALLAGDYARAEGAFEAYIEQFPEGVRTSEAKYLLGEIYLATGAYAEAATVFLDHVKSYPDDLRASEAYLKLGTAFARLDKPDEACKVFRVGGSKFPGMAASVRARFEAEQRKAACAA